MYSFIIDKYNLKKIIYMLTMYFNNLFSFCNFYFRLPKIPSLMDTNVQTISIEVIFIIKPFESLLFVKTFKMKKIFKGAFCI